MGTRVVGFIPPVVGTEGEFNTFRIGGFYAKNLSEGEEVFLLNEKDKMVFGAIHGDKNHTELETAEDGRSAERLFHLLQKIHGPHIALPCKKTTVIYMRRLE